MILGLLGKVFGFCSGVAGNVVDVCQGAYHKFLSKDARETRKIRKEEKRRRKEDKRKKAAEKKGIPSAAASAMTERFKKQENPSTLAKPSSNVIENSTQFQDEP